MLRMSTAGTVLCLALAVFALPTSSAAATPANGLIAYSLGPVLPEPDVGTSQVYTVRPDGSQVRQLTHISPPYQAGDPNWSPDGAQIAYVSDTVTRHFQVWVMNANGGHQHRLVDDPGYDAFLPRWSPDSTRLLFTRCTTVFNTYECAIVQVRADGTHLQPLTDGHHLDSSASWAPDLGIVFDSNRSNALSAIWRTTAAGPQRITPRSAEAFWPDYRHDGARILYTDNCCRPHSRLHSMRADGTDDRTLTPGCFGAYSPDGARISYDGGINCNLGLTVANADGRNPVTIVATDQLVISDWGPRS